MYKFRPHHLQFDTLLSFQDAADMVKDYASKSKEQQLHSVIECFEEDTYTLQGIYSQLLSLTKKLGPDEGTAHTAHVLDQAFRDRQVRLVPRLGGLKRVCSLTCVPVSVVCFGRKQR